KSREQESAKGLIADCIHDFTNKFLSDCVLGAVDVFHIEQSNLAEEEEAKRRAEEEEAKRRAEEEAARRRVEEEETKRRAEEMKLLNPVEDVRDEVCGVMSNDDFVADNGGPQSVSTVSSLEVNSLLTIREDDLSSLRKRILCFCELLLLEWLAESAFGSSSDGGGLTSTDDFIDVKSPGGGEVEGHGSDGGACLGEVVKDVSQLSIVGSGVTAAAESLLRGEAVETTVGVFCPVLVDAKPVGAKGGIQSAVSVAAVDADSTRTQPPLGDAAGMLLHPTLAGEARPCSAPGARSGGDSNAAMTEAATMYLVERAGAVVEELCDAGDLSYPTLEAVLRRGLLEAVSAPVSRPGEVTEEWRAGLWALAERTAADFVVFASKQKLRRVDEYMWHAEAYLTPEEISARSVAAVTPRRFFAGLHPSDLRFLVHHYVELARKGTLNEDVYKEARLCGNLFERRDDDVASTVPPRHPSGISAIKSSSSGQNVIAVNQRRAGLTQLVLGHALDNLLEDTVADTARWVASLVAR
ncbi:kinetoplast DNA-associated protein, partial [Trypanosoma rangeli]